MMHSADYNDFRFPDDATLVPERMPGASISLMELTTDVSVLQPEAEVADCTTFTFVVYALIFGTMCVFGLVGNTLCFIVLQAERRCHVATFTLQMMAVMDNLFLATTGLCQISSAVLEYMGQPKHPILAYEAVYVWPFVHICQMGTVWVTLFVAFNRYIAICRPFQAHRICTMRRTRLQAAGLCIFVVLYNLPRFFEHRLGTVVDAATNETLYLDYVQTALRDSHAYLVVYENVFYCLFVYLGPLVVLVVLNSCLFRELWASEKRRQRMMPKIRTPTNPRRSSSSCTDWSLFRKHSNSSCSTQQHHLHAARSQRPSACSSTEHRGSNLQLAIPNRDHNMQGQGHALNQSAEENSLTLVTVVIVLFFIICQTPAFVNQLLFYVFGPDSLACGHAYAYYFHISNVAVSSNSVLNFVIYCIFRQQFRERLRFFCGTCCRRLSLTKEAYMRTKPSMSMSLTITYSNVNVRCSDNDPAVTQSLLVESATDRH